MIRQMGPIAYQFQLPSTVRMDCTGESGLARIAAAVHKCGDKLAVPVLGGSSPAVHCGMTFSPLFFLISMHRMLLCAASSCPWLLKGVARVIGKNQILPGESSILYIPMPLFSLSGERAIQTGIFGGTVCNHRE